MAARRDHVARVDVLVDDFPHVDPCKVEASLERLADKLGEVGLDVTRLRTDQLSVPQVLTTCNAVLDFVALELGEYEPGKFGLVSRNLLCNGVFGESDAEDGNTLEQYGTEGDILDGALLLSLLLRIRGCISVLKLGNENTKEPVASVIQNVLGECNSLKTISLGHWDLSRETTHDLTARLRSLSNVENFVMYSKRICDDSASNIARMLEESSSCIKVVQVGHRGFSTSGLASVIGALSHCRSIAVLVFHDKSIDPGSAKLLAEFLRCTTCLRELAVSCSEEEGCLGIVLDAMQGNVSVRYLEAVENSKNRWLGYQVADMLKVNNALEVLTLQTYCMDFSEVSAVADAMRANGTLKELGMHCRIECRGALALADALKLNRTLQKLRFESGKMCYAVLKAFALMLEQNTSLVMVRLANIDMNGEKKSNLQRILKTSGACKRLSTSWNDVGLAELATNIESNTIKDLFVNFDCSARVKELGDVFDAVRRSMHVTELCVEKVGKLHMPSIENLAQVLIHSTSLKLVELRCSCPYKLTKLIPVIDALKLNKSITWFDFGAFEVDPYGEEVKHLAEVLRVNRTLHWLLFNSGTLSRRNLEVIAEGMSTNDMLLELELGDKMCGCKGLLDIRERLGRNQMMLNRAVEFVLKTGIDEDASKDAFGKLYRKDSLLEMIETVAHLTDQEARGAIEDAAASLLRETVPGRTT